MAFNSVCLFLLIVFDFFVVFFQAEQVFKASGTVLSLELL